MKRIDLRDENINLAPPVFSARSTLDNASPLKDRYGRRFSYLRLSVTEACNYRCTYCLPDGFCPREKPDELRLEEISSLVKTLAKCGTKKIRLTGGEPTLRKDLKEIIRICADTQGISEVALTSNGYRLQHQLREYVEVGLSSVNLSIDSLDAEQYRNITGHDKLQQVLNAAQLANELGMKSVKINVVLMRTHNADRLSDFVEYVKHHRVSIRFIELMRTNDNVEFYEAQHVPAQIMLEDLKANGWQVAPKKAALAGPAVELEHADYLGKIGFIMPYSSNFCSDCNRMRIAANGNLHLCLFNQANSNVRPYLQGSDDSRLIQHLSELTQTKWQGHQLEQGYSGTTSQLAMLGG